MKTKIVFLGGLDGFSHAMPRSSTTPSSAAATGLFFFFVKGASVLAALMFVGMLAFISSDMVARGNNSVAGGGNLVLSNVLCSEENSGK